MEAHDDGLDICCSEILQVLRSEHLHYGAAPHVPMGCDSLILVISSRGGSHAGLGGGEESSGIGVFLGRDFIVPLYFSPLA